MYNMTPRWLQNNCLNCKKVFFFTPARIDTAKFCSKSCIGKSFKGRKYNLKSIENFRKLNIWNKREAVIKSYNSGISSYKIAEEYNCSRSAVTRMLRKLGVNLRKGGAQIGHKSWNKGKPYFQIRKDKNPNWKGGITSLNQKIRHCIEYKNWVKNIFVRDNYICLLCHKRNGDKQVDHFPKRFAIIMSENKISSYEDAQKCSELWDTNNGRTLCVPCHNETKSSLKV